MLTVLVRSFSRFNFPFNVKKKVSTAQIPPGPGGVAGAGAQGGVGQSMVAGLSSNAPGTSGQCAGGPSQGFVSGAAGGTHQRE